MSFTTQVKVQLNQFLKLFNLRIETLTREHLEAERFHALAQSGHFGRPVFPVPKAFEAMKEDQVLEAVSRYGPRFDDFEDPYCNDVGYSFSNDYFTSPDAEVLYSIIRQSQPRTVIEVGSGNSTRIIRQALLDSCLDTRLIAIDPEPRTDISGLVDDMYRTEVENFVDTSLFRSLRAGDILFIDSSHVIKTGNDVVFLYLIVLPELPPGVLVHIHDVFLPYDYPRDWVLVERFGWNEQYLVQAFLMSNNGLEVLWAGHFLQRRRDDFAHHFPHLRGRIARSLWLRKVS